MSEHTKGPWSVQAGSSCLRVVSQDGSLNTGCLSFRGRGAADANLIAAAPDLLAICKELREAVTGAMRVIVTMPKMTDAFVAEMKRLGIEDGIGTRAEAVIAKAEGKAE